MSDDFTKLTVNLVPDAVTALERAAEITGYTKTDSVNRALAVYALLVAEHAAGGRVQIARRRWWGTRIQEVRFE
jgi:hypothetical protein